MQLEQIITAVWHVQLPKPELGQTFLRFSEYYENPHFKGKTFTHAEFEAWYKAQHKVWDYHQEWDGFNIPSKALIPFRQGKFDPLSEEEKDLLEATNHIEGRFYLIGTDGKQTTLKHEIAHAMYDTNPQYKREVKEVLAGQDLRELNKFFAKQDYHESVHLDEAQAYFASDLRWLAANGLNLNKHREAIKQIRKIYEKHYAQSLILGSTK